MSVQVVWDNEERTIIRYIIAGKWTWGEMLEVVQISNSWLDEVSHPIHFIHDMSEGKAIPAGAITQLRHFIGKEHPLTGMSVMVDAQNSTMMIFARSLLNMVYKIYQPKWPFLFVDTLDEARTVLAKQDNQTAIS
jgi:hypothetical protein